MCVLAVGHKLQLSTAVYVQLHQRRGDLLPKPMHDLAKRPSVLYFLHTLSAVDYIEWLLQAPALHFYIIQGLPCIVADHSTMKTLTSLA